MLTRKDYKVLALILRAVRENHQEKAATNTHAEFILNSVFQQLESQLITWLKQDNPNFREARFLEAVRKGRCAVEAVYFQPDKNLIEELEKERQ
jgi:hypothetical protein